jgi:transposase
MDVRCRADGDRERLAQMARAERDAKQRDRLRAALLAIEGRPEPEVRRMLGRSRRFVQRWAYAYRDGGVDALRPRASPGRPTKLPRDRERAFKARVEAGPTDADGGVCTLRGADARRILEREFGVRYTLQGVYDLLDRLNLSCLVPRPRHRKNDPARMTEWLASAPLLSAR